MIGKRNGVLFRAADAQRTDDKKDVYPIDIHVIRPMPSAARVVC
jgi:hypothetical protein